MSDILCTICARGGSKCVKNKNIKLVNGKPLIAYTIDHAQSCGLFEHIVLSTDSDDIAGTAAEYGAEVFFRRDPEMASDSAGKLPAIRDAFVRSEAHYEKQFDYLIDLDASAPLRTPADITNAFESFRTGGFDNIISGIPARRSPYFNQVELQPEGNVSLSKALKHPVLRRQDSPRVYDMNASIYIWTRDAILTSDHTISDNTGLYVMDEATAFDIDSEVDFMIVEMLLRELRNA